MKRIVSIAAILMTGLLVTACQSGPMQSGQKSQSGTDQVNTSQLGRVAGKSFTGTHHGNGTSSDPTYVYKISFDSNGKFGQEILSSQGYAARFIQQGTYTYDNAAKNIKLNLTKVTETSYASDADLKSSTDPVRLSVRTRHGQSAQTKLNAAEDKTLIVKDKRTYLLGTVNNVKLYADNDPVSDYNDLAKREQQAYSSAASQVNQKTFFAQLGTSRIWISFNDDGTWYARIIDGTHKWDIYDQGTWSVANGKLVLKTTGNIHEYTIVGDTTDPSEYSGVTTNSSRVTDNFTWKLTSGGLKITSKQDDSMTKFMEVIKTKTTKTTTQAAKQTAGDASNKGAEATDAFGSTDKFVKWLNDHQGKVAYTARAMSATNENKFAEDFYGSGYTTKPRYFATLESSADPVRVVYCEDGRIYVLVGGAWGPDKEHNQLLATSQPDLKASDSGDDRQTSNDDLTFHSLKAFADWMTNGLDKQTRKERVQSSHKVTADDVKDFQSDVGTDVKPLYFFTSQYNGYHAHDNTADTIYADDNQIYIDYGEGGRVWSVNKNLTDKMHNDASLK